jgi:hypothetical protein
MVDMEGDQKLCFKIRIISVAGVMEGAVVAQHSSFLLPCKTQIQLVGRNRMHLGSELTEIC